MRWAELLKRVFLIDVLECHKCGGRREVTAMVDGGGSKLQVKSVHLWWSTDSGWLFGDQEMQAKGNGIWLATAPVVQTATTIAYVDVVYATKTLIPSLFSLFSLFSLSSRPVIGASPAPKVAKMTACTP